MASGEAPPEITDAVRQQASDLGWEDGLIDRALAQGHALQVILGALQTKVGGEQAKAFLDQKRSNPSLDWMTAPTEWGVRGTPSDAEMGLQIGDVMAGSYGEIPDLWTNRTEIARGSHPAEGQEDMGYTIFEKAIVWTDSAPSLYERAIRDRWAAATDLGWRSLEALPEEVERAICQLLTEQSERAYAEATVLGRWLPEISYGFVEVKLFLGSVIYDLGRHAEAFRKRALANGGGLGLQAPSHFIRGAIEARTFPELMAYLFVQDSTLLTLFGAAQDFAQNQLERDLYRLVAADRGRIMEYQIDRLLSFLEKLPDRRAEQNRYLRKAEVRLAREWRDAAVSEPLALLLGGGEQGLAAGGAALTQLRRRQIEEYLAHLESAGFTRERLHSGLAAYLEGGPAASA